MSKLLELFVFSLLYKQERIQVVTHLQDFKYRRRIRSIKFIAGEQWFAAGDHNGCVHVYAYTTSPAEIDKVKEFKAQRDEAAVSFLAAYPKHTLLLTASTGDRSIKLWDWSQGWTCARVITEDNPIDFLRVGPRDTSIFASTYGNVIMVCLPSSFFLVI